MALAAITTEAPKGFEEHYTKLEDGRFRLNVEAADGYALEDISGLKSALSKERANRETLERKVSDLGDLNPSEARKAMQELEELRQLDPRAEADKLAQAKIDAATRKLGDQHTKALSDYEQRIKSQAAHLDAIVRKQAITAALAEAKGSIELLSPIIEQRTRMVEADGKYRVEVLDTDGMPMLANNGQPLTVSDYVAQLRQDERFGRAFESTGLSGTGKVPNGSSGGAAGAAISRAQFEGLTPSAKVAHIQNGGKVT